MNTYLGGIKESPKVPPEKLSVFALFIFSCVLQAAHGNFIFFAICVSF